MQKWGDEVISGCINMTGVLKIRTTKEFGESTVSKILDLVENSSSKKSRSENFISKFAKYYTPAVCYSALVLAVIPPLCRMLFMGLSPEWGDWIYRATDIPCNQLSMCTGDQYSPQFLCWNRWCQQSGRSGKRLQLSGDTFPDEDCCF